MTSFHTNLTFENPEAVAESTYGEASSAFTALRAILAVEGDSNIPATTIRDKTLDPKAEIQNSANKIRGMAINASAVRIKNSSTQPPQIPATKPQILPRTSAIEVAPSAMITVMRPPKRIREKRSRPRLSVPNRCAVEGEAKSSPTPISSGPYGAKTFASKKTARIPRRSISEAETRDLALVRRRSLIGVSINLF